MSPVLCLVGGIHLSGAFGKICRTSCACAISIEEAVLEVGIDLVGVAEADLLVGQPGAVRERLVDELRREHRVRFLDGVGGGEVVVLAGVDDDAGAR